MALLLHLGTGWSLSLCAGLGAEAVPAPRLGPNVRHSPMISTGALQLLQPQPDLQLSGMGLGVMWVGDWPHGWWWGRFLKEPMLVVLSSIFIPEVLPHMAL